MRPVLIIMLFLVTACHKREAMVMVYNCLPRYEFQILSKSEDAAQFKFEVDTNLFSKTSKMMVEFVWSNGDTGVLRVTRPGTYVCSIKGKYYGYINWRSRDNQYIIKDELTKRWQVYCYKGTPSGMRTDSIFRNNKWYYYGPYPVYETWGSGYMDTIVINHVVKPIIVGARFLNQNGKIITLNQWYYEWVSRLQ